MNGIYINRLMGGLFMVIISLFAVSLVDTGQITVDLGAIYFEGTTALIIYPPLMAIVSLSLLFPLQDSITLHKKSECTTVDT